MGLLQPGLGPSVGFPGSLVLQSHQGTSLAVLSLFTSLCAPQAGTGSLALPVKPRRVGEAADLHLLPVLCQLCDFGQVVSPL